MIEVVPYDPCTPFVPSQLDHPENDPQVRQERARVDLARDFTSAGYFRHSGWEHNRLLVAQSLARTDQSRSRRDSFSDCGSHAYVMESVDRPGTYRVAGSACHDRFCLPCAQERSHTIAGNVLDAIRKVEVRFLTLTVKTDGLSLAESLDKLYEAFSRLRRRRWFTRRVWGGVAFTELTYNHADERWHPHLHCLCTGTYLDKFKLSRLWHEVTGDSYIIDIRRPKNTDHVAYYVTKYASKPFNNTFLNRSNLLDEAIDAMKGRKLSLTWGAWRGLQLTETPEEGCWEHVAPLNTLCQRAADGDVEALAILKALRTPQLEGMLSRAPPTHHETPKTTATQDQTSWLETWSEDVIAPHEKTF